MGMQYFLKIVARGIERLIDGIGNAVVRWRIRRSRRR